MSKLNINDIDKISFPDFNVIDISFDSSKKKLTIQLDGAWLENNAGGKKLSKVQLCFKSWKKLEIRLFDYKLQKWITLQTADFEPIKDICEIQRLNDNFSLRGFGINSGLWVEYRIESPYFECEFGEL